MKLNCKFVDVFADGFCSGNPVCVVFDEIGLSTAQMQQIANWTNLSETTFLQADKSADYHLRIFTPSEELPFAGHPTLGSAWAYLEMQSIKKSELIQKCSYGDIHIQIDGDSLFFTLPKYTLGTELDPNSTQAVFNVRALEAPKKITTGPEWLNVRLENKSQLADIIYNRPECVEYLKAFSATGINFFAISPEGIHIRTFFLSNNLILEDPVCGSGNAAVAAYIKEGKLVSLTGESYQAYQGHFCSRNGLVQVRLVNGIQVGGRCRTVITGDLTIPR